MRAVARTVARRVAFVALVLTGRLVLALPIPEPHRTQAAGSLSAQAFLLASRDERRPR